MTFFQWLSLAQVTGVIDTWMNEMLVPFQNFLTVEWTSTIITLEWFSTHVHSFMQHFIILYYQKKNSTKEFTNKIPLFLLLISLWMFHNKNSVSLLCTIILSLAMLGFTTVASSTVFSSTISLRMKVEKMTHPLIFGVRSSSLGTGEHPGANVGVVHSFEEGPHHNPVPVWVLLGADATGAGQGKVEFCSADRPWFGESLLGSLLGREHQEFKCWCVCKPLSLRILARQILNQKKSTLCCICKTLHDFQG